MFLRFFPAFILFLGALAPAKEADLICGTQREGWKEEVFLHRQAQNRLKRLGVAPRQTTAPLGKDAGDIAVMYDSGGVVSRRNPFNLTGRTVSFTPAASSTSRFRFRTDGAGLDNAAASSGSILNGLDDDDARRVSLPFRFPFFGAAHTSVWINSDGNLTFEQSDPAPGSRTVGLLSGGPPRIAPLFADLDPSRSAAEVRVFSDASRFVVSWLNVPEYRSSGTGPRQTFQVRLFPDGRIDFSYQTVTVAEAVVGIAPGRAAGATQLVSFFDGSAAEFTAAIVERFTNSTALDSVLLAQRFYQTHEDAYDFLAVYNTMGIAARPFAVATEVTVRSRFRAGFGDVEVDTGAAYGSARRLQAFLNFGSLTQYPRNPEAPVPARSAVGDTPLTILAHETGHLFLALASIRDEAAPDARPLLGAAQAHWSFNFNSEASFLEGNRIEDRGENASPRFTTVGTVEQYSPLDQYLMGLRPPEEVPPLFLARRTGRFDDDQPRRGVSFGGERQNFTVDDLIAAEGRRAPDHTVAQRRFRMAIILLVPDGSEPSPEDIAQLETLRRQFETFYSKGTGERSFMETSLKRNLALSVGPAAGIVRDSTLNAAVTLDQPAAADLTVLLKTQTGAAALPASVRIPAGQKQATFAIRGVRAGVEEITAEPSDSSYRTDYARLQVAASVADLKLSITGGDRQVAAPGALLPDPIEVRASDINLIPYPGVTIRASATGSLSAASAVTDQDGMARFAWTPGNGPNNELRATIDGTEIAAVAQALGRPAFTAAAVANAASFAPGLTPGALAVLFGSNLAAGRQTQATTVPWPRSLANVQLLINGEAAALYYVSDSQVNFLVPESLRGTTAELSVSTPLGTTPAVAVPVSLIAPGLFFNAATGEAAVRVAGTGLLTSQRPVRAGEFLEIYATGLGAVRPSAFEGLQETVSRPTIEMGGMPGDVIFSGLAPGVPGLYQINARVPEGLAGVVKLAVVIDGRRSNEANITVNR